VHVFIDESSNFAPGTDVGVLCSLTLPTKSIGQIRRKISWLSQSWPHNNGELKGGLLNKAHLISLVEILYQYDAILHCCAIDVSKEAQGEVSQHKNRQCEGLTKYLVPEHHPNFVKEVWDLRHKLEKMPNQLYLQCILLSTLVWSTAEYAALYFSQRRPKELGEFRWLIDAKDPTKISNQEEWWRDTLGPLTESHSRQKPFGVFRDIGFNYSYFDKSFLFEKDMWLPDAPREIVKGYDTRKLITDRVSFIDSKSDILIQAIDILASFMRRVLAEEITDPKIIECLGRLQILRKRGGVLQSIEFLSLADADRKNKELAKAVRLMTKYGRPMLRNQSKIHLQNK